MIKPSVIRIDGLGAEKTDGLHRAWAHVGPERLWFESTDAPLEVAAEAFAGAILVPALAKGRRLAMQAAVCPQWNAQLPELLRTFHNWWGYPELLPGVCVGRPAAPLSQRIGLCFTGGVDSFFSLLRSGHAVEALVYVHDYDIAPKTADRQPQFERWLRRLSAEAEIEAIVLRTNVKRHPVYLGTGWDRAHGGALAALGHLLNRRIGKLLISSSYAYDHPFPCGSRWDIDHLWSSSQLDIVHVGATHRRLSKLQEIACEPLVEKYLRVCWENPHDRLNCSVCEKCLRTQLVLAACGNLDRFKVFDQQEPLARRIDRLRKVPNPGLFDDYEWILQAGVSLSVHQAVDDLLRRSRRSLSRKRWRAPWRPLFCTSRPGATGSP